MSQLTTNWVRIATEGQTFRNVPIERQWLVDIEETYDTEKYGARIWPEHRRWYGAWGDVLEVKTQEIDGKLVLFAKLKPNAQLLMANEDDQKVYSSIEVEPNFAGSGKAYLTGLGVTDEPASLGTERLKFSTKDRFETHHYGAPEQLVLTQPESDESSPEESRFMAYLTKFFKNNTMTDQEEDPMDKAQFKQITDALKGISDRVGELETGFAKFSKQEVPEPEEKPEEQEAPEEKPEKDEPEEQVTSEQFSQALDAIKGLTTKVDSMSKQFSALQKEVPGQEPEASGGSQDVDIV